MNTKDTKKLNYKTSRLPDDYQYEPEEEKEPTSKKSDKKEQPKKPTKAEVRKLN